MNSCLFCSIIKGDVKGDIVYQDESVVAFRDINPKAPVHILIVPRKHIATLLDLEQGDKKLIGDIFYAATRLAKDKGISEDGFRVVLNCGPGAGQSVYHIHIHLLGGRPFTWPPG
ncbi:MAG: histidine triad nucleotide-binding protein [Deltaproteobacteria bacterium]|nr:histidine triad nucleotide-binding protein [Deltaproteobacteria bacterium]